jgi:hypothetical protein
MTKRAICQEDIEILNKYISNIRARNMRQKWLELKGMDKHTIMVGDFTLSTVTEQLDRNHKPYRTQCTSNQQNLTDIYRAFLLQQRDSQPSG